MSSRIRLLPWVSNLLAATCLALLLTACGGVSEPVQTGDMSIRLSGSASAISNGQVVAKATSDNLLDMDRNWSTWSGDASGVTYNADSGTLSIPASSDSVAMVTAVERYELPLVAGTEYTLSVQASHPEMAAVLFLFDTDGAIVPVPGVEISLASVRPAAPLTFIAPENIAGLYLQVQNRWQAAEDGALSAELTFEEGDEEEPAPGEVIELIDATGPWTAWNGNENGVTYDDATGLISIDTPNASDGNRYGIKRFNTPLSAGVTYTLSTLNASDPDAATLLFLFDEAGALMSFADPQSGATQSWIAASADRDVSFVAPAGVASFVVQVQSGWMVQSSTRMVPSLATQAQGNACTRVLSGIADPVSMVATGSNVDDAALSMSADGRWTVLWSSAGNVVAGEPNPTGQSRVYLYDAQSGELQRILPTDLNQQRSFFNAMISADGSAIHFYSRGVDPINTTSGSINGDAVFRYNRASQTIDLGFFQPQSSPLRIIRLSADGERVLYDGTSNAQFIDELVDPSLATDRLVEFNFATGTFTARSFPHSIQASNIVADGELTHVAFQMPQQAMFENGMFVGYGPATYVYRNIVAGTTSIIAESNPGPNPDSILHDITDGGKYVVFKGNPSGFEAGGMRFNGFGIYRWERASGVVIEAEPISSPGTIIRGVRVSGDGNIVTYRAYGTSPGLGWWNTANATDIANSRAYSLTSDRPFSAPFLAADAGAFTFRTYAGDVIQPFVSALQYECE